MDWAEIARQALNASKVVATPPVVESVRATNNLAALKPTPAETCICGHDHESGTTDDCDVEGCDCTSYFPPSQSFTANDVPVVGGSGVVESQPDKDQKLPKIVDVTYVDITAAESKVAEVSFRVPPSPETPIVPDLPRSHSDITQAVPEGGCAHLCEKCDNWFTHGDKDKCRFPDMVKFGLCRQCMNGSDTAPFDPLTEVETDDRGKQSLTPMAQVKIRNDERMICKDMNIEQLSFHIQMIAKRELELRARHMEARKMRADKIEEEVQNVPESEREAFRQALLTGETKLSKPKREKKEKATDQITRVAQECVAAGTPPAMAKLVAQWMIKTGKTREQVEAMLND